jgi:hypothetical protein
MHAPHDTRPATTRDYTRPAACGTDSGYHRHRAEDTTPCLACCDAHAVANANARARARARGERHQPRLRSAADRPLQYRAAWDGGEPAEALTPDDRRRLVLDLHDVGWADEDIAQHTRMTTYTTARIRGALGLLPNPRPGVKEGAA